MVAISQILLLFLISMSMYGVAITSPLLGEEQEKLLEAILERIDEKEPHGKEMFAGRNDEKLSKYTFSKIKESNDKELPRNSPQKQVGDRRLKCVLYDTKSRKCLRHKMSFLWGRR